MTLHLIWPTSVENEKLFKKKIWCCENLTGSNMLTRLAWLDIKETKLSHYLPLVYKCMTSQYQLFFEGAWASLCLMCWGENVNRVKDLNTSHTFTLWNHEIRRGLQINYYYYYYFNHCLNTHQIRKKKKSSFILRVKHSLHRREEMYSFLLWYIFHLQEGNIYNVLTSRYDYFAKTKKEAGCFFATTLDSDIFM